MISIDDTTRRRMLVQHAAGDSYRKLGERYGVCHTTARAYVERESTALVCSVEISLYVAAKAEAMGREAAWPTLLLPFQEEEAWQEGLALLQLVVDRLRARDVPVHTRSRPTPAGHAFQLTLVEEAS